MTNLLTFGSWGTSTLWRGLVVQKRVVTGVFLRETRTRFGRQKLGYLWAFLEPVLFIGTFYLAFRIGGKSMPVGMDIVTFITTGLVPFQMFRSVVGRAMTAASANQALLTYPQVRYLDLHLARLLLEFVTFSVVFVVILGAHSMLFAPVIQIADLLSVLQGMIACGLMGAGVGLVLSSATILWPSMAQIQSALMRPLFWVSGVFFTANDLPVVARDVLMWNPVLHGVELIRDGFFVAYSAEHLDSGYLISWVVGSLAAGLLAEKLTRQRLNQ